MVYGLIELVPTANKTGKNTKFVSVSHAQYAHPFPPSGLLSVSFFSVSSHALHLVDQEKTQPSLPKFIIYYYSENFILD